MKNHYKFLTVLFFALCSLNLNAQKTGSVMCVPPTISISGNQMICNGSKATLCATSSAKFYLWSTGATTSCITVTPTTTTKYTCTVWDSVACKDSGIVTVTVDVPSLTACCDTTIHGGGHVTINAYNGGVSYSWVPTTGLSCDTCPDPVATPTVTTSYTVTAMDSNGCTASKVVTIYVLPAAVNNINGYISSFNIIPNPATDNATIRLVLAQNGPLAINIYNTLGQKVLTIENKTLPAGTYSYPVNLSTYSPGVYYLTLLSSTYTVTRKLVITR